MCVKTEIAQTLGQLKNGQNVSKRMGIVNRALALVSGATGAHASFRLEQHNKPLQVRVPHNAAPLPPAEQTAVIESLKQSLNGHFTGKNGYRLRLTWPCGRQCLIY